MIILPEGKKKYCSHVVTQNLNTEYYSPSSGLKSSLTTQHKIRAKMTFTAKQNY